MRLPAPLLLLLPTLLPMACDNGAQPTEGLAPGAGTPPAELDVFLSAAGEVDLSALRVPVLEVRLRSAAGLTPNLLAAEQELDFLDLDAAAQWLSKAEVAPGTYTAVELRVDPTRYAALLASGAGQDVVPTGATLSGEFALPLEIEPGTYRGVRVDLRLADAVTLVKDAVRVDFESAVDATFLGPDGAPVAVDEVHGVLSGAAVLEGVLLVEAFADASLEEPIGRVGVLLNEATLLFDEDGVAFEGPLPFFQALVLGETVLRLRGDLLAGALIARRIDLRGSFPGVAGLPSTEVEGEVVAAGDDGSLVLLLHDVAGDALLVPDPAAVGAPALVELEVAQDARVDGPLGPGAQQVRVGQRVRATLDPWHDAPLAARVVEVLEPRATLSGTAAGVPGPAGLTLLPEGAGPAVEVVLAEDARFTVDVAGAPQVDATEVPAGARLRVLGHPREDGSWTAEEVVVRAGTLDGARVTGLAGGAEGLSTCFGTVTRPFGSALPAGPAGPLEVTLDPRARFHGHARSFEELARSVSDGVPLQVHLRGLVGPEPHRIRALEVGTAVAGAR